MAEDMITRRRFLRDVAASAAAGWAVVAGVVTLTGCGGNGDGGQTGKDEPGLAKSTIDAAREAADPCNDVSQLSATARQTRETFQYETRSSDPQKHCKACNFWQEPVEEGICGTCTLVKGPIHPLGSCISWVEKQKA
jgi:hypothetical protein